jgi:hypothetical protein
MPKDGNLERLLGNLGAHRGRPIRVVEHDFGPEGGPSGLTYVMRDRDYIVIDKSAGPSRRAVILSHEIAHMLLGHGGASGTSDLVSVVAPDLDPRLVERILHRESYSTDDETAAEEVATVLAVEHGRRVRTAELRANPISARLR